MELRARVVGHLVQDLLEARHRQVECAAREVHDAEREASVQVTRVQFEHRVQFGDRGVVVAGVRVQPRVVRAQRDVERVEVQRDTCVLDRFAVSTVEHERPRERVVDQRRTRRDAQRLAELGFAARPVAIEAEGVVGDQRTGLAVERVELQRAQRRFPDLVEIGEGRREHVGSQHRPRCAQVRMGLREARVEHDGLLEQHDGLPVAVDRALLREIARAVEQVAGLGVVRRHRARRRFGAGAFGRTERSGYRGEDRVRDGVLEIEEIGVRRIGLLEAMRPELQAVLRARVAGDATDARAAALDAAFDDVIDAEQLADRLQRQFALMGLERGHARDDLEHREATERVDQLVGQADREGRVVGVSRQVAERQDGDRTLRRRARFCRCAGHELRHVAADRDRDLEDLVGAFLVVEALQLLAQPTRFDTHHRIVARIVGRQLAAVDLDADDHFLELLLRVVDRGQDDVPQEVPMAQRSAKGRAGEDAFERGFDQRSRIRARERDGAGHHRAG